MTDKLQAEMRKRGLLQDEDPLRAELRRRNLLTEVEQAAPSNTEILGPEVDRGALNLRNLSRQFEQRLPFGGLGSIGAATGDEVMGEAPQLSPGERLATPSQAEAIAEVGPETIVPAAQMAVSTNPQTSLLYNALKVAAVTAPAITLRDTLKGKDIEPTTIGIEAGKEGILQGSLGAIFKLMAKAPDVATATWEKINEFAKKYDLPSSMSPIREKLTAIGRATAFGERRFQKDMKEYTDKVTNFVVNALGDPNRADVPLEDIQVRIADILNARKSFVELRDIVGDDTPINMRAFYNDLNPIIDELEAVLKPETAETFRKAREAFNRGKMETLPFEVVDGMITDLKKQMTPGSRDTLLRVVDMLRDSIGSSVRAASPDVVERVAATGKTIEELITASDVDFARVSELIKSDTTGVLKKWAYGNFKDSNFLKEWSMSPTARAAYAKIDPDGAAMLSETWLGRNFERLMLGQNNVGQTIIKPASRFRGFMQENAKNVKDMFGEEGYETLINFSHYIDRTREFATLKADRDIFKETLKIATSGGVGSTVGGTMTQATIGAYTPGSIVGALVTLLATEGSGYTLMNQLMKPNSVLNTIFGKSLPGREALRNIGEMALEKNVPGIVGGAADFEQPRLDSFSN